MNDSVPCYRCGSQPCECDEIKVMLKRLILGEVTERGRMDEDEILDAIEEMYRRAGIRCPFDHIEEAIWSLVWGRRLLRANGRWEGQHWYTLRKPAHRLEQKVMFA